MFFETTSPLSIVEENGRYFLQGIEPGSYTGDFPLAYSRLYDIMSSSEIVQVRLTSVSNSPSKSIQTYSSSGELLETMTETVLGVGGASFISGELREAMTHNGQQVTVLTKSGSGFNEVHFTLEPVKSFNMLPGKGLTPEIIPSYIVLFHELGHASAYINNQPRDDIEGILTSPESLGPAVLFENIARGEHDLPLRNWYMTGEISSPRGIPE